MTSTAVDRRRHVASHSAAVRIALYTRKSSEKGLDTAFNSLDAQRQILEAFVASHATQGWAALAQRYDDGGFSGGNTKRPALQRLLADVRAGLVDAVACYRLDRLSRDTGDFIQLMQLFKSYGVLVVSPNESVEQATASDRLTLGVRMQVSQFEREIAAERIRDKLLASRRKGMWMGGPPMLGYDVIHRKLVVNEEEAAVVREIFETLLRLGSIMGTLAELRQRAITNKRWVTKKGRQAGGRPFNRDSLHNLLTNVHLRGQIRAGEELVKGEHVAIVPRDLWDRVRTVLAGNHGGPSHTPREASGAMLQALLVCTACGSAMTPTHTNKKGKRYSYYACTRTRKHGATTCPGSRVSAGAIEKELIAYLRQVARDPVVIAVTVESARTEIGAERDSLVAELRRHEADVRRRHAERTRLTEAIARGDSTALADRLADVERADALAAERTTEVQAEIDRLTNDALDEDALRDVLLAFDPVWAELGPAERARVVALLLERVTYDGRSGAVKLEFRAGGVRALLKQAS